MEITSALARRLKLMGPCRDQELAGRFETGEAITHGARKAPQGPLSKMAAALSRFAPKRPRNVDLSQARQKRRKWGGSSAMPDHMRHHYTEGERAALSVIAEQVKRHGFCDLAIEAIADWAGVSRTTAQNAIRKARSVDGGHITVQLRPQAGRKNLTNVIRIISSAWMQWLKRSIGFKSMNPSGTREDKSSLNTQTNGFKGAYEREKAGTSNSGNQPLHASGAWRDIKGQRDLRLHRELYRRGY